MAGHGGPVRWCSPERFSGKEKGQLVRVGSITSAVPPAAGSPMCVAVNAANGQRFVATKTALYASSPDGFMSLLAGSASDSGFKDGLGGNALFGSIFDIEVLHVGANTHLLVADGDNHCVRSISAEDGEVVTLAGCPEQQKGFRDGVAAVARFNLPCGIAIDHTRNCVYVADRGNNSIRKVSLSSGVVSTVAGNGKAGLSDGHGQVARFDGPKGVAVDHDGNVLVADVNNNCIRMVEQEADEVFLVSTIAGAINGESGFVDGEGVSARFKKPCDITGESQKSLGFWFRV